MKQSVGGTVIIKGPEDFNSGLGYIIVSLYREYKETFYYQLLQPQYKTFLRSSYRHPFGMRFGQLFWSIF